MGSLRNRLPWLVAVETCFGVHFRVSLCVCARARGSLNGGGNLAESAVVNDLRV